MSYSINEIIEFAVQIEQNGYNFYDNALNRKDLSKKARQLLTHLRDEEIAHEITFKNLRDKIALHELNESEDWETVAGYLKTIVESHIFFNKEASVNIAVNSKDEKDIFLNAILFEKDTLLFFQSMEEHIKTDKARKSLQQIINEENSHIVKLKEYYEQL